MAFEKIDQTPGGVRGSTYINVDHIVEAVFSDTTGSSPRARVKYIGGGETIFQGDAVEQLRAIIAPEKGGSKAMQGVT